MKSCSQGLLYFLVFILCTQGVAAELKGARTCDTTEDFEVEQKIDNLLLLIEKRLLIMHEVARAKWNQNLPIEDKVREQEILADLASKANEYGLDEQLITRFFQAQIDASKEMQKHDFLIWKSKGILKFENTCNLKDEIRPYIDQLNNEIIFILSEIYTKSSELNNRCVFNYPISVRSSNSIENDIWELAISPLKMRQPHFRRG